MLPDHLEKDCFALHQIQRREGLDNPSGHSGRAQPATCYPLPDTFRIHITPTSHP